MTKEMEMRDRIEDMLLWKIQEIMEHYRYLLWRETYTPICFKEHELSDLKKKLDDWYLALARYQEDELEEAEKILKKIEF